MLCTTVAGKVTVGLASHWSVVMRQRLSGLSTYGLKSKANVWGISTPLEHGALLLFYSLKK